MKSKKYLYSILFALIGCGGGTEGTGGILGAIDGNKRLAELSSDERQGLCERIVAADSIREQTDSVTRIYNVIDSLWHRYRGQDVILSRNDNGTVELGAGPLLPSFSGITPEALAAQCRREIDTVESLGRSAQCYDASEPRADWTSADIQMSGIYGPCDLNEPFLRNSSFDVALFSTCLEKQNALEDRGIEIIPSTLCDGLYEAISAGNVNYLTSLGGAVFPEREHEFEEFLQLCTGVLNEPSGLKVGDDFTPDVCETVLESSPGSGHYVLELILRYGLGI